MYISWALIAILAVVLYDLYQRINALKKKHGENGTARLSVRTKNELFDLPIIKELAGINHKYKNTKYKDLPTKEKIKYRKYHNTAYSKFWVSIRFFYDKNLIFVHQTNSPNSDFIDFPLPNQDIFFCQLSANKDFKKEVHFIIKYRVLENIIPNKQLGVYTGYLRKMKFDDVDTKEMVKLFDFPDYFINPENYDSWKKNPQLLQQLEAKLELEHKEEDDRRFFSEYTGDFGEKEYFSGPGSWWESEYCELIAS